MKHGHLTRLLVLSALLAVALAACTAPQPATPLPVKQATPLIDLFAAKAAKSPALQAAAPSPEAPSEAGAALFELPAELLVEPTCTPCAADGQTDVEALPIGQAGHYVNMTYGYRVQYPVEWEAGFGNRPVQVLFSDLSPATHLREDMRQQGCLIEIKPSVNVNNMTLAEMRAQLPRAFEGAEEIDLGGEPGYLMRKVTAGEPVHRQWVYVEHAGRTYLISMDYAADTSAKCEPVWQMLLDSWEWFTPRMVPYRNSEHGYSISMPTQWFRYGEAEDGLWFGDTDPAGAPNIQALTADGMFCRALVHENPDGLPLREWLAAENLHIHQTDPLEIEGVEALRVVGESSAPGVEFMSGYYMGRLGKVVEVVCFYQADQNWRFTPIANSILYSLSF